MVCSLHSVTTGSRDRANVSLIIIIIRVDVLYLLYTIINLFYYLPGTQFIFVWCKCTVLGWASPRHGTGDPMLLPSGGEPV